MPYIERTDSFILTNVRLSYPHLTKPSSAVDGGVLRYRARLLLPKDDPQVAEYKKYVFKKATEKWKDRATQILANVKGNAQKNTAFFDGTLCAKPGNEDWYLISANSEGVPFLVDERNKIVPPDMVSRKFYAGCYVNGSVDVFASNSGGAGIFAGLRGLMFTRDGEPFGGGAPVGEDEFDAVPVSTEEAAPEGDYESAL